MQKEGGVGKCRRAAQPLGVGEGFMGGCRDNQQQGGHLTLLELIQARGATKTYQKMDTRLQ